MCLNLMFMNNANKLNISYIFIFNVVIAVIMIGGVYLFEYNGYKPCQLCYYGRIIWWCIIGCAFIFFVCSEKVRYILLLIIMLGLLINTLFSIYHSGIEWGFWAGPQTCTQIAFPTNIDDLFDSLFEKPIACNRAAWRLFDISLAGYNAIISLILAISNYIVMRKLKINN